MLHKWDLYRVTTVQIGDQGTNVELKERRKTQKTPLWTYLAGHKWGLRKAVQRFTYS